MSNRANKGLWRTLVNCCRRCCYDWEKLYACIACKCEANNYFIIVKLSCMICCAVWLLVGSLCLAFNCERKSTRSPRCVRNERKVQNKRIKSEKRMETFRCGFYVSRWTPNRIVMPTRLWEIKLTLYSPEKSVRCVHEFGSSVLGIKPLSLAKWLENNWNLPKCAAIIVRSSTEN